MKIILTTSMSGLGGTENATFRLGRLLKQRGHDIVLASSDGPLIQEAQALGIRWQPIDFYQGGLLGYVKGMFAYMKLLKKEKPDVIHCQMGAYRSGLRHCGQVRLAENQSVLPRARP